MLELLDKMRLYLETYQEAETTTPEIVKGMKLMLAYANEYVDDYIERIYDDAVAQGRTD